MAEETKDSDRRSVAAALEAIRPRHWIKNAFVIAPILFSGRFDEAAAWAESLVAAAAFCLLSSAAYVMNDLRDREADRAHPDKRGRAIASGRLPPAGAAVTAALSLAGGAALAAGVAAHLAGTGAPHHAWTFAGWAGAFVVLNVLYTTWLKHHAIVDVLVVALGFVLRAMAGASAIAVPISPWLVVCTFTLCLFIALTKRRSELAELPAGVAGATRTVNRLYDPRDIEHMVSVSTAMAILTYSLYCLAPRTVDPQGVGSAHMIWTIPLVVYGMFRYNRITRRAGYSDPVPVLLRDRVLWAVLIAYVVLAALVIKCGRTLAIRSILDAEVPTQ